MFRHHTLCSGCLARRCAQVLLDGRSREFVFEGNDDTVEVQEARQPFGQLNTNAAPQPGEWACGLEAWVAVCLGGEGKARMCSPEHWLELAV